ncbi:MAG: preprotein translocase subunit YajC [Bacteroidales bacterium]|jgi:preprotein translocase subunit YajC|nr:preprotein translocase subunit YajC [Bacteroidales bacterium]
MKLLNLLLMMGGGGEGGGGASSLIFLLLIVVVFYFFMIRPQMKKQKEQQKFREALKKGDKIITIGGIHAKISDVQETTLIIEIEGGQKMKIEKTAIASNVEDIMNNQK